MNRQGLHHRWVAVVLACALTGAACSSDGSSSVEDESADVAVDARPPATTSFDSRSNGASSTSTSAQPIGTSTSPSTDSPAGSTSTTTTQALRDASVEVTDDMMAVFDSWSSCLESLPACDINEIELWRSGTQRDLAVQQAEQWNALGYAAQNVSSRKIVIGAIEVSGSTATVRTCEEDGTVLVATTQDGVEEIVDDLWISTVQTWSLALEGERWKATASNDRDQTVGEENNVCTSFEQ